MTMTPANVSASTVHTQIASRTMSTTMTCVDVSVRSNALLPMSWTRTSVSVCAVRLVHRGTY